MAMPAYLGGDFILKQTVNPDPGDARRVMLEITDEPFATNPHGPLARLAETKGWPILDWRVAET